MLIDATIKLLLFSFMTGSSPSPSAAASAHFYADSDPLLGVTWNLGLKSTFCGAPQKNKKYYFKTCKKVFKTAIV